ncbi:carboxypeptidase B-like [Galleria mellonella]|uniref:Carboxypeptidase B-like n=1 Tax=Galleria mellonella TaxID=7137 RepID=A0A6J1WQX8_GALME|nr:carboxypeptidase B-like [Galleria mellonella]
MLKTIFSTCLFFSVVIARHEQYEGYALYEVTITNEEQAKLIKQLENQIPVDVWTHLVPGNTGQILVPKDQRKEFQNELSAIGIEYKIETDNIREQLLLEDELLAAASKNRNGFSSRIGLSFDTIHNYSVVDQYLVDLASQYPETVTVVSGGRSFEGRDIKYLKISTTNFEDRSKPIVYLESLIHAREWITLPATLYAIERLVIDVTEQDLLEDIDWIILPILNPDGYEFTHTENRFWRKNRATNYTDGDSCLGVDLNRNFGIFWGEASSVNVCSETFHGLGPFSESETSVVQNILAEYGSRIEIFFDIHSHGSLILYGYGLGALPPNALVINYVGVTMAHAIDNVKWDSNKDYTVGNVYYVLYAASGIASDYALGIGIPLSYTYELPSYRGSSGLNGFLVDPEFIEQAGFETWEGLKVGARYVRDLDKRRHRH